MRETRRNAQVVEVFECNQWLRDALISARKRGVEMAKKMSPIKEDSLGRWSERTLFEETVSDPADSTRGRNARDREYQICVRYSTLFCETDENRDHRAIPWVIASAVGRVSYTREQVVYSNAEWLRIREIELGESLEALKAKIVKKELELSLLREELARALAAEDGEKSCPT